MTTTNEYSQRPLPVIAAALRDHRICAEALARECIARHEAVEARGIRPPLNTYKLWDPETTLAQARAADGAFAVGADVGALQGMPISVKDIYAVKGWPTYAGSPRRLPEKWEADGPLIEALRNQLAVFTGKTSTVEFAYGGLGLNAHWGSPRNPWDALEHRVCGGSSSGAGLSLLEGSALLALGTDTGGSVRIPASFTGNAGLKTTKHRLPIEGIVPLSPSLDTPGVLGRTVVDLAYAFPSLDACGERPRALDPIAPAELCAVRMAISDEIVWDDCSPGIAEAVKSALDELVEHGALLRRAPLPEAREAFSLHSTGGLASAELLEFLTSELPSWRESLGMDIPARIAQANDLSAVEYLRRRRQYAQLALRAAARFHDVDVFVAPTVAVSPPTMTELQDADTLRRVNLHVVRNPGVVNGLGLCALTIPVGLDKLGMPVGLQLMARANDDRRLLAIGLACEAALGTGEQRLGRPPLLR